MHRHQTGRSPKAVVLLTLAIAAPLLAASMASAGVETNVLIVGNRYNGPGYGPTTTSAARAYNKDAVYVPVNGDPASPANYSGHGDTGAYTRSGDASFPTLSGSGSSDHAGTLTSATDALSGTDTYGGSVSGYAAANIRTGQLHASSVTNFEGFFQGNALENGAFTKAGLFDTLTFNIAGAGSNAVTDVVLNYKLDGTFSNTNAIAYGEPGATFGWDIGFGDTFYYQKGAYSPGPTGNYPVPTFAPPVAQDYSNDAVNFVSAQYVSDTPEDTRVQLTYALRGSSVTVGFADGLGMFCANGVSCNYADTSTIGFQLPSSVTLKSASGAFLTGGVPEPSSWALTLAGFALVGGAIRRREAALAS